MTPAAFAPDRKLTDVLSEHTFTLSAEVLPPRNGSEHGGVLEQIGRLIDSGAQFLAVTKGAGGSLRGGSLPIAQTVKERFNVPCVAHFTCRDLLPADVENQLMDHHYFGIRNILALRGDPPDGQTAWEPRSGGYRYAHELIRQIAALNRGEYLARPNGPAVEKPTPTDFCIGAAAYPEHPDPAERIEFFRAKVAAGAQYGITDLLFDPEVYARFRDSLDRAGIRVPILPGTRVLKSRAQAARMMTKFRVRVPESVLARLPEKDSPDGTRIGLEIFAEQADRLRALGAPGLHVFVIVDTEGACAGLRRLARR
jgi:methylenetetrahydrofolate reductase (NADPH)